MRYAKPRQLLAVVLGSTLAISSVAMAADAPATGTQPPWQARFQQKLGLTDAQMAAIQQVHARYAASRKQLWQSLRQSRSELRQLAVQGGDPAAVQAKSAEVSQLLSQSIAMHVQSLQEISPILTPEQRAQFAQMGPGSFRHHRGPGQQAPPQPGS